MFFRDTNKYPIIWTILFLVILLTLMNIHTLVDTTSLSMIIVNFLVKSFIPTIPIIVFNAILYKRLKQLLNSGSFNFGCNSELQKSVFRAKVTISIALIFVSSQVLLWIQIIIILVLFLVIFKNNKVDIFFFFLGSFGQRSWNSTKSLSLGWNHQMFGLLSTHNKRLKSVEHFCTFLCLQILAF